MGNATVVSLLENRGVRRLVDEARASEVTGLQFETTKALLQADAGKGMTTLDTDQFIRLASLHAKNKANVTVLKSTNPSKGKKSPLEHLATAAEKTQDNFVATTLHDQVATLKADQQNVVISHSASTADLLAAVGALDDKGKKHIAVAKHEWKKVVASPDTFKYSVESEGAILDGPSWDQVAVEMRAAIEQGRQTVYKSVCQRLYPTKGHEVAVTYSVFGGQPRVSDAWVVTS